MTEATMWRRTGTSLVALGLALAACGRARNIESASASGECTRCHGGVDNQTGAPPRDPQGHADVSDPTVGAHTRHVGPAGLACDACHPDPREGSTTHMDGKADVVFGPRATAGGTLDPRFDPATGCTSVYCHGAFPGGNADYVPLWTRPRDAQATCGTCHGDPAATPAALPRSDHAALAPGATHATCNVCHPWTVDPSGSLAAGAAHLDGVVETDPVAKHPAGWTDPGSPGFHGRAAAQDATACLRCHAAKEPGTVLARTCASCHDALAGGTDWTTNCTGCHGGTDNPTGAPPRDTSGRTDTAALGVGAHTSHVTAPGGLSAPIDCSFCHAKPASVFGAGHLDGAVTVTGYTGADANWLAAVKDPGFSPSSATCATSYCHGNFPGGNASNAPVWTRVGQGEAACGTCHGAPPPPPHPAAADLAACNGCHPGTVDASGAIVPPLAGGLHLDGHVEVLGHPDSWMDPSSAGFHATVAIRGLAYCTQCHGADLGGGLVGVACAQCHRAGGSARDFATCTGCHGGTENQTGAPPRATWGNGGDAVRIGAHSAHVTGSAIAQPFDCAVCHVKPATMLSSGHVDGPTATVTFGGLATAGGAQPAPWDRGTATCASTYCHGNFAFGNASNAPLWTSVGTGQASCGTCHGTPPPAATGHPQTTSCGSCHDGYTIASVNLATHLNGQPDVKNLSCTSCHGDPSRPPTAANPQLPAAPPVDTTGSPDPASPGVGAHQPHLAGGPLRVALPCGECHVVPQSVTHSNGTVDLTFGPLATTGPTSPSFSGGTCASTYCHGATLGAGGTNHEPSWTGGSGEAACGTCHAIPPPSASGHPQNPDCGRCHTGYTSTSVDPATHVDGKIDVVPLSCTSCHGDPLRPATALDPQLPAAPPADTSAAIDTSSPGVGAHQSHLQDGPMAGAIACTQCHTVPQSVTHSNGTVDLTFGSLATAKGATATFSGGTCTNYCHGATLQGGSNVQPRWTEVDGTQAACGTCHGTPPATYPSAAHPRYVLATAPCAGCHPATATVAGSGAGATNAIVPGGGLHVNGNVDYTFTGHPAGWANLSDPACGGTHGCLTAPPSCTNNMNAYFGSCAAVPSPTCIDCHGNGSDLTLDGGPSRVSCAACHGASAFDCNGGTARVYGVSPPCSCDLCHP